MTTLLTIGVLLAFATRAKWMPAVRRRRRRADAGEAMLLTELTSLGITAGLTVPQAIAAAAGHLRPEARRRVRSVLRRARSQGFTDAFEMADGPEAALYVTVGRAVRTGAPLGAAVSALVDDMRDRERADAMERARRLPVKMLFPLALLILPGFLLLTLAPAVFAAFERLRL